MIARLFLCVALMAPALARAEAIFVDRLETLPPADVVVLGEVHDNPQHHLNQARAIRALAPAAVVWEMLTPEQAIGMPEDRADAAAVALALAWAQTGWPDYALYHPITEAAGEARHYGAGVPRRQARRAFAEGAAAVFGAQAARFGLETPLPSSEQAAREAGQFEAHCDAMPLEMMGGMVEAQRLRDAALARAVLAALDDTGGPVAVITGNGHARTDWGLPAVLTVAAPGVRVVSVAQVEAEVEAGAPWDFWVVTDPHPRGDPCAAFQ